MALIFSIASRNKRSAFFQLIQQKNTVIFQTKFNKHCIHVASPHCWWATPTYSLVLCDLTIASLRPKTKALLWCGHLLPVTHSPFWKATTATSWMTNGSSGAILSAWLKKRSASFELLVRPYSRPMYSIGKWHLVDTGEQIFSDQNTIIKLQQ